VNRDRYLNSDEFKTTRENLEKHWSISNLQRISFKDQKNPALPEVVTNKLECRFSKLSKLSACLRNGVLLDSTGYKHIVSFGLLKLLNLCIKCGQKYCSEKTCREVGCIKCWDEHPSGYKCD